VNEEAIFYCRECGEIAATIKMGANPGQLEINFMYQGYPRLTNEQMSALRQVMKEGNQAKIVEALGQILQPGIHNLFVSFYCPQCAAPYCARHWNPRPRFDEGMYDCTYGTCPKGHHYLIDD
jgi:predicted RNA-binding Zn-ribbon protein involved in translation (DUF1610 family)